ncbi:MAG: hypothetical protein AMXMBFR82_01940 [Candidatus Hydrogenedentota bacterium]
MPRQTQNYANHRSHDKSLYIITLVLIIAALLSISAAYLDLPMLSAAAAILIVIAVVGIMFRMRAYAVRVQDRVIRLEMRLRLERVLPDELVSRIPALKLSQLVGLRFASDAELPALVQKVLDGNITNADDIKKLVKDWQADHLRV